MNTNVRSEVDAVQILLQALAKGTTLSTWVTTLRLVLLLLLRWLLLRRVLSRLDRGSLPRQLRLDLPLRLWLGGAKLLLRGTVIILRLVDRGTLAVVCRAVRRISIVVIVSEA